MKANKFQKIMAAVLLTGAPMLWSACTDDWNAHYDVVPGGMAEQASLLEKMKEDPALANFCKVITSIGGAETLDSPQQLTVWAPLNMTTAQADSVIAIFKEDSAKGLKLIDNRAIKQFMQNHVALYARPVSSLTDTNVVMLNRKYMRLVGESDTKGSLEGNPFSSMQICNNGILYKTENMQHFFPNIREYTELNGMDSITKFFKQYDEYTLDETASVEGGIVDGKVVYLDSVTNLINRMLDGYAYISREDSNYLFIAPTNEVWEREYDMFRKNFNYATSVNNRDSLALIETQRAIISERFFNMSKYSRYNKHPEDSLTNSRYSLIQTHYPRTNVYYNPQENILKGLEKVDCSNGVIYIDNVGHPDLYATLFTRKNLQAEQSFNYEIPVSSDNRTTMNDAFGSYFTYEMVETGDSTYVIDDDGYVQYDENDYPIKKPIYDQVQKREYRYVEFTAKNASSQTNVKYTIPSTLSDMYYNIYVVTIPGRGTDSNIKDSLSTYFTVECKAQGLDGRFVNCGSDAEGNRVTNNGYLMNPNKYDENSQLSGYNELKTQSNFERAYASKYNQIDTILIARAKNFDVASYGLDKGVIELDFKSFGPAATKVKEKVYTRTLRFDEIILVPFATKEEADAAADNIDAFNDDLLELSMKK